MKYLYNEEVIDENELKIPINDHGFLYGVGLFETFRVYNGTPFLFDEHIERLRRGMKLIGIDKEIDLIEMRSRLNHLLDINSLIDAYVRLTVTAGTAPLGMPSKKYKKPSFIWQIKSLSPFTEEFLLDRRAVLLKTRRNSAETDIRLKSLNFLNNVIAKQELLRSNQTEGIFLTKEGYLAEGIVSNVFFVKESRVYTPAIETEILDGITRKYVISICNVNNIPVIEGFFKAEEIINSDEIFITNSIQEIVPIINFEYRDYLYNYSGITNFLITKYKESIKKVTGKI